MRVHMPAVALVRDLDGSQTPGDLVPLNDVMTTGRAFPLPSGRTHFLDDVFEEGKPLPEVGTVSRSERDHARDEIRTLFDEVLQFRRVTGDRFDSSTACASRAQQVLFAKVRVDETRFVVVEPFPQVQEGRTTPDLLPEEFVLHDEPTHKIALTTFEIGALVERVGCVHSFWASVNLEVLNWLSSPPQMHFEPAPYQGGGFLRFQARLSPFLWTLYVYSIKLKGTDPPRAASKLAASGGGSALLSH